MKKAANLIRISATDLAGYLHCRHLISLEKLVATGQRERPKIWDPMLESLWTRGLEHEQGYVECLANQGLEICIIDGFDIDEGSLSATREAMLSGKDVIVQAALADGRWAGRADILLKTDQPSDLGAWSYEVSDTKLARDTKGGTILQLSLYSEMVGKVQGCQPKSMMVVRPWTDFTPDVYRCADYSAFYRRTKRRLEALVESEKHETYPDPTSHCDVCTWKIECDKKRKADDHPCLIAGISKAQTAELACRGQTTMTSISQMPVPIGWKTERGSAASYERVANQARLQVHRRDQGELKHELLPPIQGLGLSRLPEPSDGDIFLDFEGDAFVGDGGLEYLLGFTFQDDGQTKYEGYWATTRADEKAAFERFIDFVMERRQVFPDLHIYHFGGYERGALTRLMGRYATREDEVDQLLRAQTLVDLLTVVRQGLRAGVESYSIKRLESLFGYERDMNLPDANLALKRLELCLELNSDEGITEDDRATVQRYNRDDCISTQVLRDWLEGQRAELIAQGHNIERPLPQEAGPSDTVAEWLERIKPLVAALTQDVPDDALGRSDEQQARWLLAQMLEFHRREEKSTHWEGFRLRDLQSDDLLDEKSGLSGLTFMETVGGTAKCPIHRYSFPEQECDIAPGNKLRLEGGASYGEAVAISAYSRTIDIKKVGAAASTHAGALYTHEFIPSKPQQEALMRFAEDVVSRGMFADGAYQSGRAILLRARPTTRGGSELRQADEAVGDAAVRLANILNPGVMPIQGPPGAGKTYTGARMICSLVSVGKRVGIVANSHAVIGNLLDEVMSAADSMGLEIHAVLKPKDKASAPQHDRIRIASDNKGIIQALHDGCSVAGGTAWLWSSPEVTDALDVLFVDEAAQMALANVLAVSQAAPTLILLGDPQQLDQPVKGSHPEGTDLSALAHLLGGDKTVTDDQGLFLGETWRLHPEICDFTSELFYEGKLNSKSGLEVQTVLGQGTLHGAGVRFIAVEHSGNSNRSSEEADAIESLVKEILNSGATWTNRTGVTAPLTIQDILIIAPYNAQVFEIQQRLPDARVGTVDKFQGQEAPIAIYSLTSSSHADAPRGMEFLYSLNRLNVATSRARCISVLIGTREVFEPECRTPRQMQLANAFCRFLELSDSVA